MGSTATELKSTKKIAIESTSNLSRNRSNIGDVNGRTQATPKQSFSKTNTKSNASLILSPEGELNKILDLTKAKKYSEVNLKKAV